MLCKEATSKVIPQDRKLILKKWQLSFFHPYAKIVNFYGITAKIYNKRSEKRLDHFISDAISV